MYVVKKSLAVLLALVLCVGMLAIPTYAAEVSQDGLEATLTTDKDVYDQGETIVATLTVTNTGDADVVNVSLENLTPEGYAPEEGNETVMRMETLAAGETVTLTVSFVAEKPIEGETEEPTEGATEAPTEEATEKPTTGDKPSKGDSPDTGDDSALGLWVMLLVAAVIGLAVLAVKSKLWKQMLSLVLCMAMVASMFAGVPFQANATETEDKTIDVVTTVQVGDEQVELKAKVTYQLVKEEEPTEPEVTTYTVTFESNGGSVVAPQVVEEGMNAAYPGASEKEGFAFAGWYLDDDETDLANQYDFSSPVITDTTLYAKWIDISQDIDDDQIPDDLEPYFGTDSGMSDTDGDGLTDYEECVILGTDPTMADSDGNGVTDFDEDADKDGVSNGEEFALKTNPVYPDTDFDDLSDGEEVYGTIYVTNPTLKDTDMDGADDAWEIGNGFDPTAYNDSFDVTVSASSVNVSASATAVVPGEKAVSLTVNAILDHPVLTQDMPGYIDVPFEFTVNDNLEGAIATISFVLGDGVVRDDNFVPAIYYYNNITQELEELTTKVDGNVVSAEVNHFSTYILLNKTEFDVVWENEIKPPISSEDGSASNIDVVFAIDCSGSMDSYSRMTTAKAALHTFIAALGEKDRAALVSFTDSASTLSGLTTDKAVVDALVDSLDAYGKTAMYTGFEQAIGLLTNSEESYGYKMIIILSDGKDEPSTTYSGYYAELVDDASANNIIVYTIGAGTSVSTSILTQVAENTGGAYYAATVTSGITDAFEEIQGDTVDLVTDTDKDKIPDYYEQRLTTGGGAPLDLDINNPDCDDDGLLDGEEIVITESSSGKVYGVIKSDPHEANSDMDAYGDYAEVKTYGSDPMVKNVVFMHEDTDFLIENENYVSDKYLDFYENKWYGWLERAGVWLGNRVFAANYDDVYLYKVILMEYLEQMVEESEDAQDLLDALEFSHKLVSQMNTQVGEALELLAGDSEVNEANKQLLEKLTSQLDDYEVQLEEFRNMDLTNAGQTKEQVYAMWDDVFADYLEVSDQVPELKAKVEFNTKVSSAHNATEVFGIAMDVADVVLEGVDVVKNYVNFVSKLDEMEGCLDTLLLIQNSPDSPEDLKSAAKEVYNAIKEKKVDNVNALKDLVSQSGGKVINIVAMKGVEKLLAGVVAGKYIIAAKVILGIADFAFNLGDVAEQCSCLFAISKSSTILASDFDSTISNADIRADWTIVYDDYASVADDYFSLAIMRKKSENQMKKADEANSFLIEWLFTEFMYKVEDIDTNVKKLDDIKYNYVLSSAEQLQ